MFDFSGAKKGLLHNDRDGDSDGYSDSGSDGTSTPSEYDNDDDEDSDFQRSTGSPSPQEEISVGPSSNTMIEAEARLFNLFTKGEDVCIVELCFQQFMILKHILFLSASLSVLVTGDFMLRFTMSWNRLNNESILST